MDSASLFLAGAQIFMSQGISYTYDDVGNILTADVSGNYGWTYGYDNIYQVTSADQGSATNRAIDWQYDSVYNRTLWTDTLGSGMSVNYTDNALHQYSQVGATTPTYDSNGNITSGYGGGLTVYDCENRLTTAGAVSYGYDLLGRRISRTYSTSTM